MLFPLFLLRYEFFNELYHRFLLTPKVTMKCLCLQALAIVYGKCYEEIGPFTDTKYIVGMLDRVSRLSLRELIYIYSQWKCFHVLSFILKSKMLFCVYSALTNLKETDSSSSSTNSFSTG